MHSVNKPFHGLFFLMLLVIPEGFFFSPLCLHFAVGNMRYRELL